MDKKLLLIYHEEDNDGLFSAALFYNYLLNVWHKEDIELFPATYAKLSKINVFDWFEKYTDIIMTDISFNEISSMIALYSHYSDRFVWCDHHAPIIKESENNVFGQANGCRSTDRSAILQAYKYLYDPFDEKYNKNEIPEMLRVLSAWDSWTYEKNGYSLEYVRNVNKGVTVNYNLDFKQICTIISFILTYNNYDILVENNSIGLIINNYDDSRYKDTIRIHGDYNWTIDGRQACAIYMQEATNSQFFKTCKEGTLNGIVIKPLPNRNYVISLYNIDNDSSFHCGDYLKKKYNGGGHKGAAGCTISEEKFLEILKTKQL